MALTLVVGENTYVTEAEADTYMEGSLRGSTLWAALSSTTKKQALSSATRLLDRQSYAGTKTGVSQILIAVLAAGGTGYTANDILTVSLGTGVAAQLKVLTVAVGVVVTFEVIHVGYYTVFPTSPVGVTGGTGSGAQFTLTSKAQEGAWPRTGVTGFTETEVPQQIKDAECELAFELTQDPSLETATDASKNIKRVGAGTAAVSFFKATPGARFPTIVMELLRGLTGGNPSAVAGAYATGMGCPSTTDHDYGYSRGLP